MQTRTKGIIVTAVGVLILVVGVLLGWVILPKIIESQVKKQTQLKEGSDIYEKWLKIPVPIRMKFTYFNVTNAAELQDGFGDVKPILKEVGPYSFNETRVKEVLGRNEKKDTIVYRAYTTFHYDKETSVGDENDVVTILNMPLYVVLHLLTQHVPIFAQLVIDLFLSEEKLLHTVNAIEVSVSGVEASDYVPVINIAKFILKIEIPSEFQGSKFGLWLPRNGTDDGIFEVGTGISDSAQFNVIKSINGESSVTAWDGEYCNMINGTDGMMFPPFVKKSTVLYAFGAEICRSIYLHYAEEMEYKGIPGYRFKLPRSAFENPHINGDNMCFCTPVPSPFNNSCNAAGGIRMHTCKQGAPVILSKAHFLDADEEASAGVIGLNPSYELHDSYIDIEPNTGFPIGAYKRIQASIEVQPLKVFRHPFNKFPHMFFPIVWVAEEGALDDDLVDEIKSRLLTPLKIANIAKWTLIGLGCFIIIVGAVILVIARKSAKYV